MEAPDRLSVHLAKTDFFITFLQPDHFGLATIHILAAVGPAPDSVDLHGREPFKACPDSQDKIHGFDRGLVFRGRGPFFRAAAETVPYHADLEKTGKVQKRAAKIALRASS